MDVETALEAAHMCRSLLAPTPGERAAIALAEEVRRLAKIAKQARSHLSTTEGRAVTFPEGLARATLVVMLDEAGIA